MTIFRSVFVMFVFCLVVGTTRADFIYTATNFSPTSNPYGYEVTPMNLSTSGDLVKITGSGFGDRNLNDGTNEMLYVTNPTGFGNPLWMIYRGMYDSGGPHYFGLMSWTDTEIDIEVLRGFGSQLGSYVVLREYATSSDQSGMSNRGSLVFVPTPSTLGLLSFGLLATCRRKR